MFNVNYQIVKSEDHIYLVENGRVRGQIREIGENDCRLYSGFDCPIFYPKELPNFSEIKGNELVAEMNCFVALPEWAGEYYEPLRKYFSNAKEFCYWQEKELFCRQDNTQLKAKISDSNDLSILTQLEGGEIYCDASSSEDGKNTQIAIYNADTNEGIVLAGVSKENKHSATMENEKMAILMAKAFFGDCNIFSDSKWVVERLLRHNRQNLNLQWISRKQNKIADFLSKSIYVGYGNVVQYAVPPTSMRGWLDFRLMADYD